MKHRPFSLPLPRWLAPTPDMLPTGTPTVTHTPPMDVERKMPEAHRQALTEGIRRSIANGSRKRT